MRAAAIGVAVVAFVSMPLAVQSLRASPIAGTVDVMVSPGGGSRRPGCRA